MAECRFETHVRRNRNRSPKICYIEPGAGLRWCDETWYPFVQQKVDPTLGREGVSMLYMELRWWLRRASDNQTIVQLGVGVGGEMTSLSSCMWSRYGGVSFFLDCKICAHLMADNDEQEWKMKLGAVRLDVVESLGSFSRAGAESAWTSTNIISCRCRLGLRQLCFDDTYGARVMRWDGSRFGKDFLQKGVCTFIDAMPSCELYSNSTSWC